MTARCNELQAEVERITDDKLQAYDDYTELSKEYDTMTARCKAAEELLDKLLVSNGAHIRRLIHGQLEYKTWLTLKKEAGE